MKNSLHYIFFTLFTIISYNGLSQNETSVVWVTIENKNILPVNGKNISSSDNEFQQLIEQYNISSVRQALPASKKEHLLNVYELKCDCNAEELIDEINFRQSNLSKAELGPDYTPLFTPNDYNLTFSNDYALEAIQAENAWDITKGDSSVAIGVSDTDFDLSHEELQGTVTIVDGPFNYPNFYHGTAVATIAAGNTDNSQGKSSIGSDCSLQLYNMDLNEVLIATYNDAAVINLSWASGCFYSQYGQDVMIEAYENGSIIVAAAGNGVTCGMPTALVYPAAYDYVISVTSIGPNDNHEKTIGDPNTTHQHNASVDIAAPGYDVPLTVQSGWYLTGNGSSFAAPIVSGTIGLMLSANPCLTYEDVVAILQMSADDIDSLNPAYVGGLGAGRLNAGAAVQIASTFTHHDLVLSTGFNCAENAWEITPTFEFGNSISAFEWYDGSEGSSFIQHQDAWTTVKLYDNDGCFGYDSIYTVNPEEAFQIVGISNDVSCNGAEDGTAEVLIGGGLQPYSIAWSNGSSTAAINNLSVGNYTLTVTDALGCEFTDQHEISEPLPYIISETVQCASADNSDGAIDLVVSGGTYPYTYNWNTGASSEDVNFVASGLHTVQITDANGCSINHDVVVCESALSTTEFEQEFNLYPNPTSNGTAQLNWSGELDRVEIYNSSGQLIEIITVSQTVNQLAISQLSQGLYFVKYINNNQIAGTDKLVVIG